MKRKATQGAVLSRSEILQLAIRANVDPRTVKRELAAQRGDGASVKGDAGRRVREVLAERKAG